MLCCKVRRPAGKTRHPDSSSGGCFEIDAVRTLTEPLYQLEPWMRSEQIFGDLAAPKHDHSSVAGGIVLFTSQCDGGAITAAQTLCRMDKRRKVDVLRREKIAHSRVIFAIT
jgi:hypothetical protein